MLTVQRIDSLDGMQVLEPVWNNLLAESDVNTIFLTYEWIRTWWETLGSESELYVLSVMDGGTVIGIAPLMLTGFRRFGRRNRIIQFIGTPNADYSDIIGRDKNVISNEIAGYFARHRKDWTAVDLSQVPAHSGTVPAMESAAARHGLPSRTEEIDVCMTYEYDGDEAGRKEFIIERKRNLRNSMHFFERLGGLKHERLVKAADIEKNLYGFFHSHVVRWLEEITPSKFLSAGHREFYHAVARKLAPLNRASLSILKHGDYPVAYLFAYTYGDVAHLYTITNGPFHQRKSPGIVLFHLVVEDFVREGLNRVDFARGAGSHKLRFIIKTSQNRRITLYRTRRSRQLTLMIQRLKAVGFIKKTLQNRKFQSAKTRSLSSYSRRGLSGLAADILRRVFRLLVDSSSFVVLSIDREALVSVDPVAGVTIEKLGPDETEIIGDFTGFFSGSEDHRLAEERLAGKGECFAAKIDGAVAGIGWAFHRNGVITNLESGYEPGENEVLLGDFFLSPVCHNPEIFSHLAAFMVRDQLKKKSRVTAVFKEEEFAFIDALLELGFNRTSTIRSVRILGIKLL
ncbi:MAG: GNAT family N-acetyltransferase [Candidatus Zixiibacteriota bacterium]|nr:MAG: GNAT family N-acetyltransferase [candidate division Zixibacteria bacterium]